MKEEMTNFDIAALTPELDPAIKRARIDNIYQINPTTMLLKLRQPSQPSLHLLIEAGKRLHLTSYALEKPKRPTAFCMALRKHLRNGKIIGIQQHEFERTVIIYVSTGKDDFQLTSELFGGGNIILVNSQNKILHALTYRKMRDRNILRGEVFQHAPPHGKNPLKLSHPDFDEIRTLGQLEIVRALTKFLSIGGLYAEEILLRASVNKDATCESLTRQETDRILNEFHQILSNIETGNVKPCIVIDERGEWIDVAPMLLKKYAHFKQKPCKTINGALDEYYTKAVMEERVVEVSRETEQELAKQRRILKRQRKALKDSMEETERNRKIGDVIYAHLNDLQFLLQKITGEKRDKKSWKQIVSSIEKEKKAEHIPAIHFYSLQPERLILNVSVNSLVFPLNIRRSVQVNAANYYRKAKKAKRKIEGIKKALEETQTRILNLQQQRLKLVKEKRKRPPKGRKKAWYEKFRWFHSSDGFLVLGGRDATTNEILVKKRMEPHDVVFHADVVGAPFVLIKTNGKHPSEQTIKESAQLAVSYSRAWREMLDTVNAYWVSPKQVSKSPSPLKRGTFVIRGSKNYVRNVPLRIAIGVKMKEERPIVVGCPVEAISKQTSIYVEIIPGNQKSGELAKCIRRLLAKKTPEALQKRILEIPLEEIQRFIPSGQGAMKPQKR